jgi:hypothetical protein
MGEIVQEIIVEFRIICETLFFTFLILKLTDVITWSWWWVFSPILASCAIVLVFSIILMIIFYYGKRREKETVQESN